MMYHFRIHEDPDIFWGECIEMDYVISQATSLDELKCNLREALEGILKTRKGHNLSYPLPNQDLDNNKDLLKITVSADTAFSLLLRDYRINRKWTQNTMMEKIGIRSKNSYVKLERGGNPTLKTVSKVKDALPDFPVEKCF